MAEIKSSIELAMERTRGLVATREEREEMARKETESRIRALVRKRLDGHASAEEFQRSVRALQAEQPSIGWKDLVCRECASILTPGENQELLLLMVDELQCSAGQALRTAVRRAVEKEEAARWSAAERVRAALAEEGISGSSVVPNVDADPAWQEERAALSAAFLQDRDAAVALIGTGRSTST